MTTTERVAVSTDGVPAATPAALETGLTGGTVVLHVLKGAADAAPHEVTYEVPMVAGMVVLDAVHYVQHNLDTDLACRWNCKAAKCGSCSAEVNGRPVLLCKTRIDDLPAGPVTVHPLKTFPLIKDLVTDVSRNYEVNKAIPQFTPSEKDLTSSEPWRIHQKDIERVMEFRKCIECFLCQDVCHVLRAHDLKSAFYGPRSMVRIASLEMHPLDTVDRLKLIKDDLNIGLCNITKCCTEVCPEHIKITDNALIPMKERVVGRKYDPLVWLGDKIGRRTPKDTPKVPGKA